MIDRLQVKQSFGEPSSDDTSVLEHAIEKNQWINMHIPVLSWRIPGRWGLYEREEKRCGVKFE